MVVLRYLFIFAFLLCFCSSLYGEDECEVAKNLVHQQIREDVVKISKLTGGRSGSKVLKVDTQKGSYVVKFIKCGPENEIKSTILLAEIGVGPKVYFADRDNGIILMKFIKSVPIPVDSPLRSESDLYIKLGELLKKIHSLRAPVQKIDVLEYIHGVYEYLLKTYKLSSKLRSDLSALMEYAEFLINKADFKSDTVSHYDLIPQNILFTGEEFMVIDGSVMGLCDPYYDIAAISLWWCFSKEAEKILLTSYLERAPSLKETEKLESAKKIEMLRNILSILSDFPDRNELNFIEGEKPSLLDYCVAMKGKIDTDEKRLMLASILRDILFDELSKEKKIK